MVCSEVDNRQVDGFVHLAAGIQKAAHMFNSNRAYWKKIAKVLICTYGRRLVVGSGLGGGTCRGI